MRRLLCAVLALSACGAPNEKPPAPAADCATLGCAAGEVCTAGACERAPDTIVLDPSTISFMWLPINSLRGAFSGYDPLTQTCATVIWYEDSAVFASRCE